MDLVIIYLIALILLILIIIVYWYKSNVVPVQIVNTQKNNNSILTLIQNHPIWLDSSKMDYNFKITSSNSNGTGIMEITYLHSLGYHAYLFDCIFDYSVSGPDKLTLILKNMTIHGTKVVNEKINNSNAKWILTLMGNNQMNLKMGNKPNKILSLK